MAELRWALLLLGAAFVVGLALWEWRRGRARRSPMADTPVHVARSEQPARREPSIGEFTAAAPAPAAEIEWPEIRATGRTGNIRIGVSAETAVDVPGAEQDDAGLDQDVREPTPSLSAEESTVHRLLPDELPPGETTQVPLPADSHIATDVASGPPAIRWPPDRLPDRVLGLRVAAPAGRTLSGQQVRLALQAAGLRHGPQQIFHRTDEAGNVLASVANLLRPGSLLPERMDSQEYRGLSLFAVLPGAMPDEDLLEELVQLARALAHRLSAVVQDEYGQELDAERLTQLRRAVAASADSGDGARA